MSSKINFLVGPKEPLLATVKSWKLALFGHVARHGSLSKTILQGNLDWRVGDAVVGKKKMLDGQYQSVDIPVHARTAHKGLLHKRLEENLY